MPIKPESGKVYRDGEGTLVHIEGPAKDDGYWWSLEGNHYDANGRMRHREWLDRHALVECVGEHSDAGKGQGWSHSICSVCTED